MKGSCPITKYLFHLVLCAVLCFSVLCVAVLQLRKEGELQEEELLIVKSLE